MKVAGLERAPLTTASFDVIVVGGGINGVAIARECARARKRVLLLERHDFASGTTSRSTRIIHGGLRYLEHGEIALVRESLRERNRLLCERPHLVRATRVVLALPRTHSWMSLRSALAVRAGLALYRRMAPSAWPPRDPGIERELDLGSEFAVFDYEDAQCEFPERLVAEWLGEAAHAGAEVRNHAEVLTIRRGLQHLSVRVRDRVTGVETWADAPYVVNASGPWVDEVCAGARGAGRSLVGGVRGSHILLERFAGAPQDVMYTEAEDGRPFFVVPWNGQLLVGTTEVRHSGDPAAAQASAEEIDYLLRGFNRLFPERRATLSDVRGTFSGVRPLPYSDDHRPMGAITRRSFIHDHGKDGMPGLFSIVGGKLTTAASLARQCARVLGMGNPEPPLALVAAGPASGFENTLAHWSHQIGSQCGISPAAARAAAEWHGRAALCVLRRVIHDRRLAEPIVEGSHHLLAEAVHAVHREHAVTLGDILLRRVPLALTHDWTREQSAQAAQRIGTALGWSPYRSEQECEAFESERERLLGVPGGSRRAPRPAEHAA